MKPTKVNLDWKQDVATRAGDATVSREMERQLRPLGILPSTLKSAGSVRAAARALPASITLRKFCPPTRFQGALNTCSSHVVAEVLEFSERRAFGTSTPASRLFLHLTAGRLAMVKGSTPSDPVYIRQVIGVLNLVGAPPERMFPYPRIAASGSVGADALDKSPDALVFALSKDYRALESYRLDLRTTRGSLKVAPHALLYLVRRHADAGLATTMGIPLFESVTREAWKKGYFAYPSAKDVQLGAHALMVVGYDDRKVLTNSTTGARQVGALLVQNSWGKAWGSGGFGWVSYEYVLRGKSSDHWVLLHPAWLSSKRFQLLK